MRKNPRVRFIRVATSIPGPVYGLYIQLFALYHVIGGNRMTHADTVALLILSEAVRRGLTIPESAYDAFTKLPADVAERIVVSTISAPKGDGEEQ